MYLYSLFFNFFIIVDKSMYFVMQDDVDEDDDE